MIGSTFKAELVSAGVTNWNFCWTSAGDICFASDYPDDQKTIVENVLAAHVYDETVEAKTLAKRIINSQANTACAVSLTSGSTQEARYALKLVEAKAYQADTAPTEESYPMLYGEVGITATTVAEVAATIIARATACDTLMKNVEVYRKKAIAKVEACTDADTVATVLAGLSWPTA